MKGMNPAGSRRFNLTDMAILIAVAAVSLASLRPIAWLEIPRFWHDAIASGMLRRDPRAVVRLSTLLAIFYPALAVSGAGVLWIRLRHPRPRPSRLWRQPGFVAVVAASLIVAVNFIDIVGVEARLYRGTLVGWPSELARWPDYWSRFLMPHGPESPQVGPAVASAWLVLALSGRWRAEPSWIDRAGRVVGVLWILVHLVPVLVSCLPK